MSCLFFSSNVGCRVANSTKYFYIPTHFLSTAPALIIGLSILLDLAKLKNLCSCRRTQPTLLRVQNTWEICIVIFKLPRVSRAVCVEVYKLIGPT